MASGDTYNNRGLSSLNLEDGSISWSNHSIGTIRDFPVLADVENDGIFEVFVCVQEMDQIQSYNADNGSFFWSSNNSEFAESSTTQFLSSPSVGDINKDGFKDIIAASNDNSIIALNGRDGTLLWKTKTEWWNHDSPVLGDVDNDGQLDILLSSGDRYLHVFDGRDGSEKWSYKPRLPSEFTMSPALGDVNADGTLDIVLSNENRELLLIDGKTKKSIWSINMPAKIIQSATILDIDNDNKLDVLVRSCDDHLYALKGSNGKTIWSFQLNGWFTTDNSPPYINDIDSDNHFEILILSDDKVSNSTLLYVLNFPSDFKSGFRIFWMSNGGNPQKTGNVEDIDDDSDTLSNLSEYLIGTNPSVVDSDMDTLPDYYELSILNTNPLVADTDLNEILDGEENFDKDKMSNFEEYQGGTDPFLWDTDHDLLSDSFDSFPLFAEGWFYWCSLFVILVYSTTYFILKMLRRKK
ncbi:MAG: VCBS repeat-containing protein [Candidatus Heimdallarchaeota archaeon]|nr:VCBS repeat-containing protein [Candidatus Heimdallarchaeota archaeon]